MTLDRERIEKLVLLAVLVVGGVVCAWMFYLAPRFKAIAGGSGTARELDEEYREAQNIIKRAERSRGKLKELKLKIAEYDKDIPPELMDEWILNKVNAVSRKLDVMPEELKPEPTEDFEDKVLAQSYCRKRVKLRMRCGYHTLGKFLNGLENANPFISINDLVIRDLNSPGRGDGPPEDRQEIYFTVNYVARKEVD